MKNIVRQLLPPIITNLVKGRRTTNADMPKFASYEAALAFCEGVGYEHGKLIEAIRWSTGQLRDRLAAMQPLEMQGIDFKNLLAMERAVRDGELRVIDFGGACGGHYFKARAYFGDRVRLRWHVVETGAMVAACASLASEELQFHESVEDARRACPEADLLFTAGALVYTPDPLAFTRRILESNARFLYITRQGLLEDNRTVVSVEERKISKGVPLLPPGMDDALLRYPVTWVPRAAFERLLGERYRIELHVIEDEVAFSFEGQRYKANGYLGRRADL